MNILVRLSSSLSAALRVWRGEPVNGSLCDFEIKGQIQQGCLQIDPFNEKYLNPRSLDLTLGRFYFRRAKFLSPWCDDFINMYDSRSIRQCWGTPLEACTAEKREARSHSHLENIEAHERIIVLEPGEVILAHTEEFVICSDRIALDIRSKSTFGRAGFDICGSATWVDPGFAGRLTLMIRNTDKDRVAPLVCGRPIIQVHVIYGSASQTPYKKQGKYHLGDTMAVLKEKWRPEDILPKIKPAQKKLAA